MKEKEFTGRPQKSVYYDQDGQPRKIAEFASVNLHFLEHPESRLAVQSLNLAKQLFRLSDGKTRRLEHHLMEPTSIDPHRFYFMAAVDADQVVGISCFYYLDGVRFAYLEYLGVSASAQKQGLGTFLYDSVLATLNQKHPNLQGLFLEIYNHPEDLDYRKEFFLNLGAIPLDLSFYPAVESLARSKLMLMFDPVSGDACVNRPLLQKTFLELSAVL